MVWYIDVPPSSSSPMHRTVSFDIVPLVGENELALSTGETRVLSPGDMTIQRSTMHEWRNASETEWTRMLGVMAECVPVAFGEMTLGPVFPEPLGMSVSQTRLAIGTWLDIWSGLG